MQSFRVIYRNPGHWDIKQDGTRIFKIRGRLGDYTVYNDQSRIAEDKNFNTLQGYMGYIIDLLMYEPIKGH